MQGALKSGECVIDLISVYCVLIKSSLEYDAVVFVNY